MKRLGAFIPSLLLLFLVIASLFFNPSWSEDFSLKVFDRYQNFSPRPYTAPPVRVIDIDDETLKRFGQWPWPRIRMAHLVSRLHELGASAIVLDMVFAEPDRTSPANILPVWQTASGLREIPRSIKALPDHDEMFAAAMRKAPVVLGFSFTPGPNDHITVEKAGFSWSGGDPRDSVYAFNGVTPNLPVLEAAGKGNGSFNYVSDRDGLVRRIPLVFQLKDKLFPGLSAEALRVSRGASSYFLKTSGSSGESSGRDMSEMVAVRIGDLTVPTDERGQLWLYDTGFVKERYIPAWKVLEGELEPGSLKDFILFVGTSAAGLKDIRATPLNPVAAGVEVHAQLAEQILEGQLLNRPDWARGAECLFLLLLGLALTLLMPLLGAALCALLGTAAIAGAFVLSWLAFSRAGLLLDPVLPALMTLLIYLVSSLLHFLKTEAEKRQVRSAFSRYMSPQLVRQLAANPERLRLGGETRHMTVLFADIRNFTTLSEGMSAAELTRFMNRYLTPMTDIILREGGTIDKYIGDCIMAFWNAPLDVPDHAGRACRAALEMSLSLQAWNETLRKEAEQDGKTWTPVVIGIGLNTGDCSVGNMGSDQRFDFSVLGDAVNLASRLESLSKQYGVTTLTGETTQRESESYAFLEMDLIRVKGKTEAEHVFGLAGTAAMKNRSDFQEILQANGKMLSAYREGRWKEAAALVRACRSLSLPELSLGTYWNLYQARIAGMMENPPGPGWDGITTAESK